MTAAIKPWDGKPVTEPGFYTMPELAYHADPVPEGSFSSTQAKQILRSPANLRHYLDSPREEKAAYDFGHLVHGGVLGVGLEVRVIPDEILASNGAASTTAAKDFIALAREDGAVPIKAGEWAPVAESVNAVLSHDLAGPLFTGEGESEVSAFAQDPETGLWLRARYDRLLPNGIVDLKTARDGDPFKFEREALRLGYDAQDAFYQFVYRLIEGGYPADGFTFVTVETSAPHLVDVHQGDSLWEMRGQARVREAIDAYKRCMDTNEWPGREPVVNAMSIPNYMIDDDEDVMV